MTDPAEKESCGRLIDTPAGTGRFMAFRMEYFAICNGDEVAAALLNEFEFMTSCEKKHREEAQQRVDEPIWLRRTSADMRRDLWYTVNEKRVEQAAQWLVDVGYLQRETRKATGRSYWYHFDTDAVQAAVNWWHAYYTAEPEQCVNIHDGSESSGQNDTMNGEELHDESVNTPDHCVNTHDDEGKNTQSLCENAPTSESLLKESSPEVESEAPAETRAGAREAAAAGQTPFPAPLKLVRASPNGAAAAANERASPERGGEDHDGANAKIFALYKSRIGSYDDPAICDELARWHATLPEAKIEEAFMQLNGRAIDPAKRWPYVRAILQRLLTEQAAAAKQAAVWATAADEVIDELADRWRMPETPREFTGDPEAARNWERTLIHLESVLGASTFDVYLRGTRLVDVQGDTYVIAARNEYARNHLQAKLYRNVASALGNISGKRDRVTIEFVVQDELERA